MSPRRLALLLAACAPLLAAPPLARADDPAPAASSSTQPDSAPAAPTSPKAQVRAPLALDAAPRGPHSASHAHPHAAEAAERPPAEAEELAKNFSAPELREHLGQFYTFFVNALEGAVARAELGETDVEKRERLTLIKIRAARACRAAAFQNSPLSGYIDTLSLCLQLRALARSPEAAASLGADTAEFVAFTETLDREITAIGNQFLDPETMDALHARLDTYAKDHPLGHERAVAPPSANFHASLPGLGWVINLPLAPFRALQGVDQTAQAVSDFNGVADGFSRTIAYLPLELAWESQLLVLQARRESEAAARGLIDHAALRAGQLLAGCFAFALFWGLVVRRLAPRKASA